MMKRFKSAYFLVLLIAQNFLAQDLIMRRDSSSLTAKITEIRPEHIFFTPPNASTTHSLSASQVAYIILQNGYTQKFKIPEQTAAPKIVIRPSRHFSLEDSIRYFSYDKSISVNYLCFINREFGVVYQREILKKQISIVIPFTLGMDRPTLTHRYYFKDNFGYTVSRKLFDTGIGVHYFPNYRRKANFYIGPLLKAHFYRGEQILLPYTNSPLIIKKSFLSRVSLSLTTGYVIRTRSRLQVSLFTSMGACADFVPFKIRRPLDNKLVNPIGDPLSFYFSAGFLIGYCF